MALLDEFGAKSSLGSKEKRAKDLTK